MSRTTVDDIAHHRATGSWRALETIAQEIVAEVSKTGGRPFSPVLGGGTRLMLALNHRMSDDIDLFHHDAQWIGYLTPRKNELVESIVSEYEEANDFLKLKLVGGEIDFIISAPLLNPATDAADESLFPLEAIDEVIAKKLFHRGARMKPRDLFDWHAVETLRPGTIDGASMGKLLLARMAGIEQALALLGKSAAAQEQWEAIRAPSKPALTEAAAWGRARVSQYLADVRLAALHADRAKSSPAP